MDSIIAWVLGLFGDHPAVAAIFLALGVLRAINKPLFALIQSYVNSTPGDKDNKWWAKIQKSEVMKGLLFILDWSASIKLPRPKGK